MSASSGSTGATGPRGWWQSPPRTGMRRLINPWEYRHLRAFGVTRVFGGSIAAGAGAICLSYRVYGWAGFFLVIGSLNIAGGCLDLSIDSIKRAAATET
jgi:hypothetical protein